MPLPAPACSGCRVGGKDPGDEPRYAKARLAADRGMSLGPEDDPWCGAQGVVSALAKFVPGEIVEMYRRTGRSGQGALSEATAGAGQAKEHAAPAVRKKLAQARYGMPLGAVRPPLLPAPSDYDPSLVPDLAEATG